jgi:tetratricopeptide (TPR) repeat protein
VNSQAYTLYLQGRHAVDRYDQSGFEEGSARFQEALQLDPSFARAAEWLSWTYVAQAEFGFLPVSGMERAREAAALTLRLDPNSAMAHALMGEIHLEYDWDWSGADLEIRRALALEPHHVWALLNAASLAMTFGHWDEAVRDSKEAIAVSPLESAHWYWLAHSLMRSGRLAEAEVAARKTLEISPTYLEVHSYLGVILILEGHAEGALAEMERESDAFERQVGLAIAYHALGREAESKHALAQATALGTEDGAYSLAEAHAFLGETDAAITWLDRAYQLKSLSLSMITGDPLFKNLAPNPRYKAFLRKMKLPD